MALKKRYTVVLVLVFCLTATLFIVASTGYNYWCDLDDNGDVDPDDFAVFAGDYGSWFTSPPYSITDTDWDGDVDADDFALFAGNYGKTI